MKEVTYGWYPSVNDIYRPKGRPASYLYLSLDLECLYKHGDSMYYQGQIAPPEPELFVRGMTNTTPPPTPQELRKKARSVPVPKFSRVPKLNIPTPSQCWNTQPRLAETQWGVAGEDKSKVAAPPSDVSWPLPKSTQKQQRQQHQKQLQQKHHQQQLLKQHIQQQQEKYFAERHQTPQYAWGLRKTSPEPSPRKSDASSSDLAWPVAHKPAPPSQRPKSSACPGSPRETNQPSPRQQRPVSSPTRSSGYGQKVTKSGGVARPPSAKNNTPSNKPARIQSATVRKAEKTPVPSRPVTASPGRLTPRDKEFQPDQLSPRSAAFEDQPWPPTRPAAPVPFIYDNNEFEQLDIFEEEKDHGIIPRTLSPTGDDYQKILDKYGWRAEVHGDPYKLKRPLKRISYAVECDEPEMLPDPPNVHMETNEPFFYNTIPKKPMTFAVDKEWMSEVLLAKRLELQKRDGGIKYQYKRFAFVY